MSIRIACGTGWSRDQFEPARILLQRGELDFLFFDSMSEMTMSQAQVARAEDPDALGYDPYVVPRLGELLASSLESGTRIISNSGWLDPEGAARALAEEARRQGLPSIKIAYVTGGSLLDKIPTSDYATCETGRPLAEFAGDIVGAEAYLGAEKIAEALDGGAHVVLTPRVSDASLVLGPLLHHFRWSMDDWDKLGWGIAVGHLIECGGQVAGGFFADPGYSEVPDLEELGYPFADIHEDHAVISKVDGTGGRVTVDVAKEQLLYEVGDPASYFNPDVVCDLSAITLEQVGEDAIRVQGGTGREKTPTLKVLVTAREGYMAEEIMSFAGPGAYERAELAKKVLVARLERAQLAADELRFDYIGLDSVHREATPYPRPELHEYVLRVAVRADDREEVDKLRREIDPMATSGPAATGKWAPMGNRIRPVIGLHSALVPREDVPVALSYLES